MELTKVKLAELQPADWNPNTHPESQIQELMKSLADPDFRQFKNIVVWRGLVIAGKGVFTAAQRLGWAEIEVEDRSHLTEEKARALCAADIALPGLGVLDPLGFQSLLDSLPGVEIPGVTEEWLASIGVDTQPPASFDDAALDTIPDIDENLPSITQPGDLWELGAHRLLCGDSTKQDDVARLMNGEKADILFTSPPYNAGRFGYDNGKDKYKGDGDDKTQDEYLNFLISFTDIGMEVSQFVLINNQFLSGNIEALALYIGRYAKNLKEVFPWIKSTAAPNVNKGFFTNRFEFFICLEKGRTKKGFPVEWQGKYHNVIEGATAAIDNIAKDIHSATMPLYVPTWFLERLEFAHLIYEPFCGTGTTLIACERLNRRCFSIEISPTYCDVIVKRWETLTGQTARRLPA